MRVTSDALFSHLMTSFTHVNAFAMHLRFPALFFHACRLCLF